MSAASTGLPRHAPCWGTKFRRVCEKVAKKKQSVALLSWLRGRLSANRLYNEFTVGGWFALCSFRISGKLGCTLARTRKLN